MFEGSTKADWFNHWLKECLFKELPENATIIMDNAAFHKTAQTKQLFDDPPYNLLYLPPYSPDFNPVETVFANLRACFHEYSPRTFAVRWLHEK